MKAGRGNRLPVLNQGGRGEQEEEEGGKGEKTLGWKEEGTQDILIQLQTRLPGR